MGEIVMPRLSDTMEEGTILRWLKTDGEHVARGEELVELETDKATMTYESDQEGTLQILAAVGSTLAVGELIARVGDGDAAGQGNGSAAAAVASGADGASAGARSAPAAASAPAEPDETSPEQGERVKASPLARRIAREQGVDLSAIAGTGPGGRVVRANVEQAVTGDGAEPATATAAPTQALTAGASGDSVSTAKGETTTVELSRTQQTIARRMAESKATIPEFTLQTHVDMQECVTLREKLKSLAAESEPQGRTPLGVPTYNDMVVKASALALREHPRANSSYRDGRLALHSRVNVGVAVAAHDALIVPTVFDADGKALGEISRETRALAERVRSGEITPPKLGGGTFTVSNLGMYGVGSFSAIINPPQAAILSVGALEQRAVVRDGEIVARSMLTLTLACDHRILYGAEAAQFLARVRELLEGPYALTL